MLKNVEYIIRVQDVVISDFPTGRLVSLALGILSGIVFSLVAKFYLNKYYVYLCMSVHEPSVKNI